MRWDKEKRAQTHLELDLALRATQLARRHLGRRDGPVASPQRLRVPDARDAVEPAWRQRDERTSSEVHKKGWQQRTEGPAWARARVAPGTGGRRGRRPSWYRPMRRPRCLPPAQASAQPGLRGPGASERRRSWRGTAETHPEDTTPRKARARPRCQTRGKASQGWRALPQGPSRRRARPLCRRDIKEVSATRRQGKQATPHRDACAPPASPQCAGRTRSGSPSASSTP